MHLREANHLSCLYSYKLFHGINTNHQTYKTTLFIMFIMYKLKIQKCLKVFLNSFEPTTVFSLNKLHFVLKLQPSQASPPSFRKSLAPKHENGGLQCL